MKKTTAQKRSEGRKKEEKDLNEDTKNNSLICLYVYMLM